MSTVLKPFTMVDYDPVKDEACMSFLSPNTGDTRKLWICRDTLMRLVGIKRWNRDAYGEPLLYQTELKTVLMREFPKTAEIETWFDSTSNDLMRHKAQGKA